MTRRLLLALLASSTVFATACGGDDSPTGPSAPPEVTGTAPYSATDLVVGTGAEATIGGAAALDYTLWLYSDTAPENKGRRVQSSKDPGLGPYTFVIGVTNAIRGWHQGVPGMRVGGTRRLVLPPDLAYGSNPPTGIPVNATLLFELELLAVQ